MKTDSLIIKMIDELKEDSEKDHNILHERIDKIETEIKAFSKFRWQIGGVLVVVALLISAGTILPLSLTQQASQVIMGRR
jgi:hypothetical protein